MGNILFRGTELPVMTSIDDLDLDAAEVIEGELGLDLRDLGKLPKIRMMKTLTLISVRVRFPDATMAEVGKIKLNDMVKAFADMAPDAEEPRPPVEFTGSVVLTPSVDAPAEGEAEVLSPSSADSEDSALSA